MDCIFCKIVSGDAPAHKVYEDDKHLAFLSIFPNTPGVMVVITKEHYSSYVFDLPEDVMESLMLAAKKVAKKIDAAFDDVGRTAVVFEGFGVNHIHVKLFPLHGTGAANWRPRASNIDTFFTEYQGYISSHDSNRADDGELEKIAKQIRGENEIPHN